MKSKFTFAMLAFLCIFLVHSTCSSSEHDQAAATTEPGTVPEFVTLIDDRGNGFSGSINEDDIKALADAGFKQIIRLNGDTFSDRGKLSIPDEARQCQDNGIRLYYFNIEEGIIRQGNRIRYLMRNGSTLIHCKHGAHRAPAMAAYYLQTELGIDKADAIERVGWGDLVKNPGRYARYTEAVLR